MSKWLLGIGAVMVAAGCTPPAGNARAEAAAPSGRSAAVSAATTNPVTLAVATTAPATPATPAASTQPAAPAQAAAASPVSANAGHIVARVNGREITVEQLDRPLIQAYGLNVLLNLVQLELAKQQVENAHQTVTRAEIDREQELMLEGMFPNAPKEDYPRLLEQMLTQERITRPVFDIVVETNAYIRKLVAPVIPSKINEAALREAFSAFYGENVRARDIRLSNLQEVAQAKQRLAAGESFEDVARTMSRDGRTAPLGGALPPFSRQTGGIPQALKDAAFSLKAGEVSDPVEFDGAYHLVQVDERIAPKAVKFEDVKDAVRQELEKRLAMQAMKEVRAQLAQLALQTLEIRDEGLRKQWGDMQATQQAAIRDQQKAQQQLEADRERMRRLQGLPEPTQNAPATQPAASQGGAPSILAQPVGVPGAKAGDEPPATKPGQ